MVSQNPEVSALSCTLLGIAWKKGRQKGLTNNAALNLSLYTLRKLITACREENTALVLTLTGQPELPRNFLVFAASLSNEIDLKIQHRHIPADQEVDSDAVWTSISDYDHSVFLALGQTLANAAWPDSSTRDLHAPGIENVLASLARYSEDAIQIALVQNYVANVLQDYLDRAQARVAVRSAPAAIEQEIRRDDCRIVAELAYQVASRQEKPPTPEEIQTGLGTAITSILERNPHD